MSYCRFGNEALPQFYIYRTWRKGLVISVLGSRQELSKEQVECLEAIFVEHVIKHALSVGMDYWFSTNALGRWHFSSGRDEKGNKVLIVGFPDTDMELNMNQVVRLIGILHYWVSEQECPEISDFYGDVLYERTGKEACHVANIFCAGSHRCCGDRKKHRRCNQEQH